MEESLHELVGSLSHYSQGFIHPRWLFGISEPSTVARTSDQLTSLNTNEAHRQSNLASILHPGSPNEITPNKSNRGEITPNHNRL